MELRRSKREGDIRKVIHEDGNKYQGNKYNDFCFTFQKTQSKDKKYKQKQEPKQFLFFHIRAMKMN